MWTKVADGVNDDGWVELDDNGWGALIGWAAGEQNLRRVPVDDTARSILVSRTDARGTVQAEEPFTPADRESIDADANSYLAEAGVPPRPGGFAWFIRLPQRFSSWEQFSRAVTGAVSTTAPDATHPSSIAPVMHDVVRGLYT
jgi:hypothetical protein